MTEHSFILRYQLAEDDRDMDAIVERLGEAGCTDATVGIGTEGVITLDFTREAASAEEAIQSAIADAQTAVRMATLIETIVQA